MSAQPLKKDWLLKFKHHIDNDCTTCREAFNKKHIPLMCGEGFLLFMGSKAEIAGNQSALDALASMMTLKLGFEKHCAVCNACAEHARMEEKRIKENLANKPLPNPDGYCVLGRIYFDEYMKIHEADEYFPTLT